MKVLHDIIHDIRQRRNLDVYITVFVALFVTALDIFQIVDPTVVSSAILAVLALVSVSLLVNRRENDDIQVALSKVTGQPIHLSEIFQTRSQSPSLEERFAGAQSIDIAGMSLLATSTSHHELLLRKAKSGCQIRLLLLNPNNEALMSASCVFVAPLTPEAHRQEIVTSLNSLTSDPALFDSGNVQIRISDYLLSHGILSVNGEASDGQMRIEIYLYKKKPTGTLGVSVQRAIDRELFDTFQKEFNDMWASATLYLNHTILTTGSNREL